MKHNRFYANLRRYADKATFSADEAEDLLQTALLAAVEAGRADMTCLNNRRWLLGVMRNRAAFDARTAVRRRARETSVAYVGNGQAQNTVPTAAFVRSLPTSLKTTTQLALTGHTKAEIAYLLRVSDAALRQRIVQIKRRWRTFDGRPVSELSGLINGLPYGRIRKALLNNSQRNKTLLATHDPDGHLFMVTSQNGHSRQPKVTSIHQEE